MTPDPPFDRSIFTFTMSPLACAMIWPLSLPGVGALPYPTCPPVRMCLGSVVWYLPTVPGSTFVSADAEFPSCARIVPGPFAIIDPEACLVSRGEDMYSVNFRGDCIDNDDRDRSADDGTLEACLGEDRSADDGSREGCPAFDGEDKLRLPEEDAVDLSDKLPEDKALDGDLSDKLLEEEPRDVEALGDGEDKSKLPELPGADFSDKLPEEASCGGGFSFPFFFLLDVGFLVARLTRVLGFNCLLSRVLLERDVAIP